MDRAFLQLAGELTVENRLLLKSSRLVIPKSLQTDIQKLHVGHKCHKRAKTICLVARIKHKAEEVC